MTWDSRGRLWVTVMPSYPHWKPKDKLADKVLVFEDTNGDGVADKCDVFADGLHVPTGIEFYDGGIFVGAQPDLMYLKDTNGDGKADVKIRVLHGLDSADTHHAENSFANGPGGALFFQEGTFHQTQVETPYGPPIRNSNAGVYRYEPRTMKFGVYTSYGFANPHGHVFDHWGQDFITDGTGNVNYWAAAFTGHTDYPRKHKGVNSFFKQRTRPAAGTEIISSRHFPDEFQGDYLIANVIGFQGLQRYKIFDDGAGFGAKEVEPIVFSTDPNFRPTDIELGPDGAIYFLDWQNSIIGHMQHNLRDPSRDTTHGRIYRVTAEGRELLKPKNYEKFSIPELLDELKMPEDRNPLSCSQRTRQPRPEGGHARAREMAPGSQLDAGEGQQSGTATPQARRLVGDEEPEPDLGRTPASGVEVARLPGAGRRRPRVVLLARRRERPAGVTEGRRERPAPASSARGRPRLLVLPRGEGRRGRARGGQARNRLLAELHARRDHDDARAVLEAGRRGGPTVLHRQPGRGELYP